MSSTPQLSGGGASDLVPLLAVAFIVAGIAFWVWQVRPVRVALRRHLGERHARRHGPLVATPVTTDTPDDDSGLDAEMRAFDLDMFGPLPDEKPHAD